MKSTALFARWWPVPAAAAIAVVCVVVTAATRPWTPAWLLVTVGVGVAVVLWWVLEQLALADRAATGKPPVVYPGHQATAGPKTWLLTTPTAYRWLGGWLLLGAALCAVTAWPTTTAASWVAFVLVFLFLFVSGVVVAIVITRRPWLIPLCVVAWLPLVLLADAIVPRVSRSPLLEDDSWLVFGLAYGSGCLVVAAGLWWCRTHPRSVDPRTELGGAA